MSEGGKIGRDLEKLPVGFRFAPTDEELIDNYLKPKILGMDFKVENIPEVDICKWDPWELPGSSVMKADDPEGFFFSLLDYKYSKGSRSNRTTKAGYWKPTGKDRDILSGTNKEVIGTKKTLVFYIGRSPAATRTNWVIHEYRTDIAALPAKRPYVLCRLKRKTDENTGSDIPIPDEAVAGTGIHLSGQANNKTLGAGPSHHSSNVGNSQVEEMTLDEYPQLQGLLNDFTSTPPGSDWFSKIQLGLGLDLPSPSGFNNSYGSMQFQDGFDTAEFVASLIVEQDEYHCEGLTGQGSSAVDGRNLNNGSAGRLSAGPQSPQKGVYGKDGGSSSNTDTTVLQGSCLQAKDRAEYGYPLQNKNPIREFNRDCKVTEKANRKRSSIWNEPVGMNKKGSFSSPETASASHEPSSSPGYLVNLLLGILLFVVLIAVMVIDINAKV
ncbi:protein NTM1-like 9 isoform X2 [Vitis riparia]|uniref:protein NTM1-like 9 isoform X2 n=1 Tax=Vitis riparia TaxID=96939 RepID=UPI00155AA151|nr:protein NTM1-like 9 isoform X2 [Vitis riparia]